MRATFAIAALAGSALAVPHYGRPQHQDTKEVENVHVVVETVVATVYVTDDGYAAPTPAPEPEYEAPAVTTVVYEEPAAPTDTYEAPAQPTYEAPQPTYEAPQPTYEAPKPTYEAPKPTYTAPAPSKNTGYMAVVDTWRAKLKVGALAHDAQLESNAMDCVKAGNGQMVHKLNPGSYGQVLAPGNADDFEHVFVGGWLCEMPDLDGLQGVCATQSQGWYYNGQEGHAKILKDPSYTKIGCALYAGIWGCDVA